MFVKPNTIPPYILLRVALISFLVGIFLRSFNISFEIIILFTLIFCFSVLFFNKKILWLLATVILFINVGIYRYNTSFPTINENFVGTYAESKVTFQANVSEPPDVRINHQKITLNNIILEKEQKKLTGKILVRAPLYPEYSYGDVLSVTCTLKNPLPFKDFAYDRYLAKDNIFALCNYGSIEMLTKDSRNNFKKNLFTAKQYAQALINKSLPEPQAGILSAMVLGNKQGIPNEVKQMFSETGISHIVAISGMHITIVASLLFIIFGSFFISRRQSFLLVTTVLLLYIMAIGFPASAVRAAIMGIAASLAILFNRKNNSLNALLLAAAIMVFLNPKILRDDIGFQLSCAAVLGITHFNNLFINKLVKFSLVKQTLAMTLAAQIATMPLIVFYFGIVSLSAPLVNIFVVPILPGVLLFGIVGLGASFFLPSASFYFFLPAYVLITIILKISYVLNMIPALSL